MATYMYVHGMGDMTKEEYLAHKEASAYDERLSFKRNPDNGQYAIFVRTTGEDGFERDKPALGFGNVVPTPDQVKAKLHDADTWQAGGKMLSEMDRRKAEYDKLNQYMASQVRGDATEKLEHIVRMDGGTNYFKSTPKVVKK